MDVIKSFWLFSFFFLSSVDSSVENRPTQSSLQESENTILLLSFLFWSWGLSVFLAQSLLIYPEKLSHSLYIQFRCCYWFIHSPFRMEWCAHMNFGEKGLKSEQQQRPSVSVTRLTTRILTCATCCPRHRFDSCHVEYLFLRKRFVTELILMGERFPSYHKA